MMENTLMSETIDKPSGYNNNSYPLESGFNGEVNTLGLSSLKPSSDGY